MLVVLGIDGGDQEFCGGADGLERLFELFAVDVVGSEIIRGDVIDSEVAHDHVGGGFSFQFALAAGFGFGFVAVSRDTRKMWTYRLEVSDKSRLI